MRVLLDTNIVARSAEPTHPQHRTAVEATRQLRLQSDELVIVPQVVYEFWVVATRPIAQRGLGFDAATALSEIGKLEKLFLVLQDSGDIFAAWKSLIARYTVSGKSGHDARLVAAMLVHGISDIITFNKADFTRYAEIKVRTPEEVLASISGSS